ncbi:hypothetical protein SESBI_26457 [Sesbania bispinosa]|nr:hypothetical protein SESBI_26457 [Sesbania bispinosa]
MATVRAFRFSSSRCLFPVYSALDPHGFAREKEMKNKVSQVVRFLIEENVGNSLEVVRKASYIAYSILRVFSQLAV